MNQTYQPSGKISILFIPAFAAMLLISAAATFACTFLLWFSPYTIIDAVIFIIFTGLMAKYSNLLCIKGGKVRSPLTAVLSGLILNIWYWYHLVIFHLPVKEIFTTQSIRLPKADLVQVFQLFRFSRFWETVSTVRNEGAAFTGKTGSILFVIPGMVCIIFLALLFTATALYFSLAFYNRSRYPFCEASGRWAKEVILNCSLPENEELFLSKLLLGDTATLSRLRPLDEVNVDHYQVTLYVTGRKEKFYASVSKMEGSQKTNRHTGKIEFDENELAEYLVTDRATGLSLLSRRSEKPEDAAIRIVTDETEKKDRRRLVTAWICGVLQLLILVAVILHMKNAAEFLLKGGFFYIMLVFLNSIIQFVRSFQKETVIISTEERYEYDGIKKYLGTEKPVPPGYRLYYLFLMFSAIALFCLCIWRI